MKGSKLCDANNYFGFCRIYSGFLIFSDLFSTESNYYNQFNEWIIAVIALIPIFLVATSISSVRIAGMDNIDNLDLASSFNLINLRASLSNFSSYCNNNVYESVGAPVLNGLFNINEDFNLYFSLKLMRNIYLLLVLSIQEWVISHSALQSPIRID